LRFSALFLRKTSIAKTVVKCQMNTMGWNVSRGLLNEDKR